MKKQKGLATIRQIKMIHTIKSVLKINDEMYRSLLKDAFNADTSKALTRDQARRFIDELADIGVKCGVWNRNNCDRKYEELGDRPEMATPAQMRMVEGIWNELYPQPDEKARTVALRKFLYKFFMVSDVKFLDQGNVSKVLYALKQMQANREVGAKNAPETHITGKAV